jgi:hypothetical protein
MRDGTEGSLDLDVEITGFLWGGQWRNEGLMLLDVGVIDRGDEPEASAGRDEEELRG